METFIHQALMSDTSLCDDMISYHKSKVDTKFEYTRPGMTMGGPNDTGKKGTTVLMYAKTKYIEEEENNISLIKLLLDNGADIFKKDKFGYDVFHYLNNDGIKEKKLIDFLLKYKN